MVFLVDPQSYNNLAKYDSSLIRAIAQLDKVEIKFYGSTLFGNHPDITQIPIFCYQKYSSKLLRFTSYVLSLFKLLLACLRCKPKVIHVQWVKVPSIDFIVYALIQKLIKAELVYTAHNVVPHGTESAKHIWLSRFLKQCDRIVVHHDSTGAELKERFGVDGRKIVSIHHGPIPLSKGKPTKALGPILDFCTGRALVFGFIGSGTFYKGFDILVNAWKKVPNHLRRDNGVLLCGKIDPSVEQSLGGLNWQCSIEGLMVCNSYLTESDLDACVSHIDVVVLPHRKISQSGVLMSVLDRDVCYVAADHPAFVDIISKYNLGWIYDGSEASLARLLEALLMNYGYVMDKKLNAQGRISANLALSWDLAARATTKVYLESMNSN